MYIAVQAHEIPAISGAQIFEYMYKELCMVIKNEEICSEEAVVQPGQCDTCY